MNYKNNIAYLAPEIPALSATFVYQEILQLEKSGLNIHSVSIHRPINKALSTELENLEKRTFYLYEQAISNVIISNLFLFLFHPIRYFSTIAMVIADISRVGLFSHVGKGLGYRFFVAAGLVRFLRKNNIDHIHANFAHIPTDITMYAAALHGISFSFISHANDLFERGWLLKEKVERAKFAVTISNFNKKFLVAKGANEEKINVIHCGVNTSSFNEREEKALSTPPLLGSLGRMVEKKGFDVLILACSLLKKEGVEFKLQLAGGGPLMAELKDMAHRLDVSNEVEFIDSISHEKVPEWIKSLDIFVLPCQKDRNGDMDGIPVVLMESMLTGIPVVTTRISGVPELVEDKVTGLLCEANDATCLSDSLSALIKSKSLRNDLIKNAVLKVKSEFELNENVDLLIKKLLS